MFVKVKKYFQGGIKEDIIYFSNKHSEEEIEDEVEYWAEYSSGGHNYGYSVEWQIVEDTKELIKRELDKIEQQKGVLMKKTFSLLEGLETRKNQLENDLENIK